MARALHEVPLKQPVAIVLKGAFEIAQCDHGDDRAVEYFSYWAFFLSIRVPSPRGAWRSSSGTKPTRARSASSPSRATTLRSLSGRW